MICNECGVSQLEGALFCAECGASLSQDMADAPYMPTTTLPFKRQSQPSISEPVREESAVLATGHKRIIFVIPSSRRRLVMELKRQIYIGRADPEAEPLPILDLTHDGAAEAGVSRRHALLQLTEKGVVLRDLDSTNGTLLNNQVLTPDAPYLLRSGDEVHFGELLVHILFD